jgi:intron-binding protein aquarius
MPPKRTRLSEGGAAAAASPAPAAVDSPAPGIPSSPANNMAESSAPVASTPSKDFEKMTVAELKAQLANAGVACDKFKKKADYVAALQSLSSSASKATPAASSVLVLPSPSLEAAASNAPSQPAAVGRTTRRSPSPPPSSKTPANLVQAASPAASAKDAAPTAKQNTTVSSPRKQSEVAPVAPVVADDAKRPRCEPSSSSQQVKESRAVREGDVPRRAGGPLQTAELENDSLTLLAKQHWKGHGASKAFNPKVIAGILETELRPAFAQQRVMVLETNNYLELYLWPNFTPASDDAHVLSIIVMVNEKFRENTAVWPLFADDEEKFIALFNRAIALISAGWSQPFSEQAQLVIFLINAFVSIENKTLCSMTLRLVLLPLWKSVYPARVEREISSDPALQKYWARFLKKDAKGDPDRAEISFFPSLISHFLSTVDNLYVDGQFNFEASVFCNRVMELLIDLLAQLPTRRFLLLLLLDMRLVEKLERAISRITKRKHAHLLSQQLHMFKFYVNFPIDDRTGGHLSPNEITAVHYGRMVVLQKVVFAQFGSTHADFAMTSVAKTDSFEELSRFFSSIPSSDLRALGERLKLFPADSADSDDVLVSYLSHFHERQVMQLDAINSLPLYPNENVLWDMNLVPSTHYAGETSLALPKLNLQYLTFYDYLLRNFNLFRLESTYEIRESVDEVMKLLAPRLEPFGNVTTITGWAKMALRTEIVEIVEVAKPRLGDAVPAHVLADVTFNSASLRDRNSQEAWSKFREHDVLFLICTEATVPVGEKSVPSSFKTPRAASQVKFIRGGEVVGYVGEDGKLIPTNVQSGELLSKNMHHGTRRTVRIALDPSQYALDIAEKKKSGDAAWPYKSFNIIMRRNPEENNFKAVLECVRDIMNEGVVLPDFLKDILLGYGDAGAAHYSQLPNSLTTLDFCDTFLDEAHIVGSFPGKKVSFAKGCPRMPPFRCEFADDTVTVTPYLREAAGPYPQDIPKTNAVRFTPMQVEAIRAAVNPGLTLIVGPPGTGKTDVAVQAISNLYHNFPGQRILIITHSNQALNDIFEKIMVLDIHERHLLRLGHGEEFLDTDKDFSKWGRVNFMLAKRLELLAESGRLAAAMNLDQGTASLSCENAGHFYLLQVVSKWEEFCAAASAEKRQDSVLRLFPFMLYFATAPVQPLFSGTDFEADMRAAQGCWKHISDMYTFLQELRAFEVLRTYTERSNYLVSTQAKIIAMTCTHAALKRHDFIKLKFEFDSLVMEEAAQVLEIETFIPLLLQSQRTSAGRLKRAVFIGDHNQLPPVIQNMAFQKYSRMDQSLFARLVRLGVPAVQLNFQVSPRFAGIHFSKSASCMMSFSVPDDFCYKNHSLGVLHEISEHIFCCIRYVRPRASHIILLQGRSRPSISRLYNWRYEGLLDMQHVASSPAFQVANSGFAKVGACLSRLFKCS